MRLGQLRVLSKEDLETIHSATLELFEKVGIKVDDEKTRKLFQEHGAEINEQTHFVKLPESLVKEKLKEVPT